VIRVTDSGAAVFDSGQWAGRFADKSLMKRTGQTLKSAYRHDSTKTML